MGKYDGLRIGYLVQQFPPEVGAGPARVTEMAAHWLNEGAKVTVFTGMPNRPQGRIHPDYRGKAFVREQWRGIDVVRSWLYATPTPGFASTVANNVSFMLTGAVSALAAQERWDVIIASSPPFFVHLAGEAVSRLRRIPLVLEVRDLWPDYLVGMGLVKNRVAQKALFGLERYLLRRADSVVVVTESFRERIREKGVSADRISVIPNGVDLRQYSRASEVPPIEALQRKDGEYIVGYLGNFGAGQDLSTVLHAAARLERANHRARFVIVGDGPERQKLGALSESLGLRRTSIHPPIPKEQTRAFYNACDLCLVPLAGFSILQETIPSKIFEIMACERPVLASLAGEGARIVADSGGGSVVEPGNPEAIARGIDEMSTRAEAEIQKMGRLGRAYVTEHYSRDRLAASYLEVLARVAGLASGARETVEGEGARS